MLFDFIDTFLGVSAIVGVTVLAVAGGIVYLIGRTIKRIVTGKKKSK